MKNGIILYDDKGEILHAHGGHIIKQGEYYYWFGENRTGEIRVSCYRSKDLETWEFRNHVLTCNSKMQEYYVRTDVRLKKRVIDKEGKEILANCNIERPKVLYNERTKQYVMWMHYENGINYADARCAVAVCDTIDGDYIYYGSFNPIGNMSRDCNIFTDDDKTAYFISAARENADLILYRLTKDYLAIDEQVRVLWPGQAREAPVLFKRNGIYYMLNSACTGWAPNQGKYAMTENLTGTWSELKNFGDKTTYNSQPAFVLCLENAEEAKWIYVGDRWNGNDYKASTYIFLPLQFNEKNELSIDFIDELKFTNKTI